LISQRKKKKRLNCIGSPRRLDLVADKPAAEKVEIFAEQKQGHCAGLESNVRHLAGISRIGQISKSFQLSDCIHGWSMVNIVLSFAAIVTCGR
jgi:hypothetical protein